MKRLLPLLFSCLLISARAQTVVIDGLHANGALSWGGDATNFSRYHIEWAPSLSGPWSATWNGLTNLVASNNTMTVAVPMFYRVVGLTRPPAGEDCENAPTNAPGTYFGTTLGYANDFNAAAQGTPAPGRDRAYRVTIPAFRILTVTMTPTNAPLLDAVLLVYSGAVDCSQITSNLLAATDAAAVGLTETITWTNNTAVPISVLVVADSFTAEPAGNYLLDLALTSVFDGDNCELAETIAPGTINGQTTVNYTADRSPVTGCTDTAGPDRYFRITIPTGQTLDVTVVPTSPWDAAINIITAEQECPAPTSCLAGVDNAGLSGLETLDYVNETGAALDVFIVVSGFTAGDAGTFNLSAVITP